ncbi:MAG: 50S ribosomal protein L4 [Candidatus Lokiarchaeota archaeon]|nr:50S ribosomal protein L4 [Candidatus Lokiarchaeota archaeon]
MPEAEILNLEGKLIEKLDLPEIFSTDYKPWIIRRAQIAVQANRKQPKGRDPLAGKRNTAESRGPGHGIARVPRVKGSGTRRASAGAFVNMTVGGRVAFPPVPEKVISEKINKKERRLAIRSAIAATANKDLVILRGHQFDDNVKFPVILSNELEGIKTTKEIIEILIILGLYPDVERASVKKIRAGKGKMRGRRYKKKKGILIVGKVTENLHKAARNIPGIDVSEVRNLNADLLAPGGHAGRLTIWTKAAIEELNNLFK